MNTIIEKIRAWVEREKEKQMDIWRDSTSEDALGMALDKISVYNQFLSFLSDLEKEEKPKFKVGDEVIISNEQKGIIIRISDGKARVEMGDTMQIVPLSDLEKSNSKDFPTTDEEMKQFLATHPKVELPERYKTPDWMFEKSEKPMQEELEKEIDRFEDWMETYNQADYPTSFTTRDIARHFAQWQKEQMMKEAMETEVTETCGIASVWIKTKQFKPGQKVRIIIVKED